MSARATDRIWWAPANGYVATVSTDRTPIHFCTTAVVSHITTRTALDPMALGTCRYCRERLPIPPDAAGQPQEGGGRSLA